jgi:hypothetical protein
MGQERMPPQPAAAADHAAMIDGIDCKWLELNG